ncbi:MAG: hypothetical protein M0Q41_08930 [Bacteroidales bacterium]|nr:hypothetical protein [Bacteroidales bacterium]
MNDMNSFFRLSHNHKLIFFSLLSVLVLISASCSKPDNDLPEPIKPEYIGKGFFVLNQGNFTAGNSSLSFYNYDSARMINNFFYQKNDLPLGDVGHSVSIWNDYAFIVVNNSSTIWSMNATTGKVVAKLSGLYSPRYIQVIDAEKAYVSDFNYTGVTVINPSNLQILGNINTGKTTENLLLYDTKVFTTNWTNYNQTTENNTVQVIDARFDKVSDSIVVAKEPNSMVLDKNERLWVLCSGGFMEEEYPALFRINPKTLSIEKRFNFPSKSMAPEALTINNTADTLYFINYHIYQMALTDDQLPDTPWVESNGNSFYRVAVDPNNNMILVSDVGNYMENGYVFRYKYDGMLVDSIGAGIIPAFFAFN